MEASTIAILITIATFVCFAFDILPLSVTAICACLAMAITGVITFTQAFAGFGNDMVMLIIGVNILGTALFETGVGYDISKFMFKFTDNEKKFVIILMSVGGLLSAFLSSTAVVAMFIPIINMLTKVTNGRITKKNTYLALANATGAGNVITMVGSTAQILAVGLLTNYGYSAPGMFSVLPFGLTFLIIMVLYYFFWGYKRQLKVFDYDDVADDEKDLDQNKVSVSSKKQTFRKIISVASLLFCMFGFVSNLWTVGAVAMFAAAIVLVCGCLSEKAAFRQMNWSTIFVLAGSLGFSKGLEVSGACEIITRAVINFLGSDVSKYALFIAITILTTIMTNIISNTATVTMLVPIAIPLAITYGVNPVSIVMGIAMGANLAFASPLCCPHMTIVSGIGGYKFKHYFKMGSICALMGLILAVLILPLCFPL